MCNNISYRKLRKQLPIKGRCIGRKSIIGSGDILIGSSEIPVKRWLQGYYGCLAETYSEPCMPLKKQCPIVLETEAGGNNMEENKINIEEPVVETEEAAAEAVEEIVADKAEEAADIFNEAVKEAAEIEEEVVSPTDEQEEFVGEAEEAAEEVKAITDNIVNKIKEVLADGNVTFIRIRKDDNVILNLPMTAGIIGTVVGLVAAPWAIILATISTIGLKCIVEVEKKDGTVVLIHGKDKNKE